MGPKGDLKRKAIPQASRLGILTFIVAAITAGCTSPTVEIPGTGAGFDAAAPSPALTRPVPGPEPSAGVPEEPENPKDPRHARELARARSEDLEALNVERWDLVDGVCVGDDVTEPPATWDCPSVPDPKSFFENHRRFSSCQLIPPRSSSSAFFWNWATTSWKSGISDKASALVQASATVPPHEESIRPIGTPSS